MVKDKRSKPFVVNALVSVMTPTSSGHHESSIGKRFKIWMQVNETYLVVGIGWNVKQGTRDL